MQARHFINDPGAIFTTTSVSSTAAPAMTTTSAPLTTSAAAYTGQALLTGSCASPIFSSLQFYSPHSILLEMPLVDCSDEHLDCCPEYLQPTVTSSARVIPIGERAAATQIIEVPNASPVSICPSDYVTLGGVCCPSGYSLYPTSLYDRVTPCYSSLATPFALSSSYSSSSTSPFVYTTLPSPSFASSITQPSQAPERPRPEPTISRIHGDGESNREPKHEWATSVVIITDRVFALGLPYSSTESTGANTASSSTVSEHGGLSPSIKAAVGSASAVGAAVLIGATVVGWCWRKRTRGARRIAGAEKEEEEMRRQPRSVGGDEAFIELHEREAGEKCSGLTLYPDGDMKTAGDKNASKVSVGAEKVDKATSVHSVI